MEVSFRSVGKERRTKIMEVVELPVINIIKEGHIDSDGCYGRLAIEEYEKEKRRKREEPRSTARRKRMSGTRVKASAGPAFRRLYFPPVIFPAGYIDSCRLYSPAGHNRERDVKGSNPGLGKPEPGRFRGRKVSRQEALPQTFL